MRRKEPWRPTRLIFVRGFFKLIVHFCFWKAPMVLSVSLIYFFYWAEASCRHCLPGWYLYNTSCYFYSKSESLDQRTWQDSREHCRQHGATLIVIDDASEQVNLASFGWAVYIYMISYQSQSFGKLDQTHLNSNYLLSMYEFIIAFQCLVMVFGS